MPSKERFQHAPDGACISAVLGEKLPVSIQTAADARKFDCLSGIIPYVLFRVVMITPQIALTRKRFRATWEDGPGLPP